MKLLPAVFIVLLSSTSYASPLDFGTDARDASSIADHPLQARDFEPGIGNTASVNINTSQSPLSRRSPRGGRGGGSTGGGRSYSGGGNRSPRISHYGAPEKKKALFSPILNIFRTFKPNIWSKIRTAIHARKGSGRKDFGTRPRRPPGMKRDLGSVNSVEVESEVEVEFEGLGSGLEKRGVDGVQVAEESATLAKRSPVASPEPRRRRRRCRKGKAGKRCRRMRKKRRRKGGRRKKNWLKRFRRKMRRLRRTRKGQGGGSRSHRNYRRDSTGLGLEEKDLKMLEGLKNLGEGKGLDGLDGLDGYSSDEETAKAWEGLKKLSELDDAVSDSESEEKTGRFEEGSDFLF